MYRSLYFVLSDNRPYNIRLITNALSLCFTKILTKMTLMKELQVQDNILLQINFLKYAIVTVSLPAISLLWCFVTGIIFQFDQVNETVCKVRLLPVFTWNDSESVHSAWLSCPDYSHSPPFLNSSHTRSRSQYDLWKKMQILTIAVRFYR